MLAQDVKNLPLETTNGASTQQVLAHPCWRNRAGANGLFTGQNVKMINVPPPS
jgi:hypothetical protein